MALVSWFRTQLFGGVVDGDDRSRLARPDHDWQQNMARTLIGSPTLGDRQAFAFLIELIEERLGQRVSLREQPTTWLRFMELVRFCDREENGLTALSSAVSTVEGHSRTSDRVSEMVREHIVARSGPPPFPQASVAQLDDGTRDFFVSYTSADRGWAAWMSWQLEAAGYSVLVQEWDFVPGSNWPVGMERGVTECRRTIAVLSPDYLNSVYGRQEWQAVQSKDALGLSRKLVPVRVKPCEPPGLLANLVYIDLVGQAEEEARKTLLDGIGGAESGRSRPALPPDFPG
ncbi:toll/interleukin-1 receptor domain-containing protein [Streptomyces sp. NPDC046909]|uniref:toll/interleukin-1 receptor domain-containing protein n=1 Tax=Streptomyces sp. NPDC046909 TaxID=3155617 RepID=UPI0033F56C6E